MKNFTFQKYTITLFFFLITFSPFLLSQKKHKTILSGYLNTTVTSEFFTPGKLININTDLQAGYFFSEKIAIGGKMPFNYQASDFIEPSTYLSVVGFLPFIQIHPFKQNGPVDWFFWIETGIYLINKSDSWRTGPPDNNWYTERSRRTDWSIGGGIGLNYFLAKNIALGTSVKLDHAKPLKGGTYYEYPDFDLKFGILILIEKPEDDH